MTPFKGNCPRNVNRDAKYAVRWADGEMRITLVYRHPDGEQWLASTSDHPDLVKRVNETKESRGEAKGGPFYINEFHQLLVPAGPEPAYYLAGDYTRPLEFEFEGHILSGDGRGRDGRRLLPGEEWEGPHPGIPYVASASGDDVYYEAVPRPNVTKKVRLSAHANPTRAREIAKQVIEAKGGSGRFYVNEFHHMFAPVSASLPVRYVYVGKLDPSSGWFPRFG